MEERKRRIRPNHQFTHTPVDRFAWEQLVRRAELDASTKLVAWALATWASEDGGDLIVGERLLADAVGRKERFAREHLAILREKGLLEALTHATPGNPVEYQLTFPGEGYDPVEMRLDPTNARIIERPVGRAGKRRPVKNTGTPAPVNNPDTGTPAPVNNPDTGTRAPVSGLEDRHPGAADRNDTGTRAHEHRHPGAETPAPGCHQPLQDHPLPTPVLTSYSTPTSASSDFEPPAERGVDNPAAAPLPTDLEYARASRLLRAAAGFIRDDAITAARKELEAAGLPADRRSLTVHAAALLRDHLTPQLPPLDIAN